MSVREIQQAIEELSVEDRLALMQWLNDLDEDEWDRQMKRDAAAGKFDKMRETTEKDYRSGRREIEFVAAVRQGLDQLDRGEGVPLEEVEKQLPQWLSK